jgi:hypothetical protein
MGNIHIYFGIENLAMTTPQRQTLLTALQTIGVAPNDPQPARREHWRVRLDNEAAIFEALFDEAHLTVAAMRTRLATLFGIASTSITPRTEQDAYGLLATFAVGGTDRMRLIAFGYNGGWPAWETSRQAVLAYLKANSAAWEPAA